MQRLRSLYHTYSKFMWQGQWGEEGGLRRQRSLYKHVGLSMKTWQAPVIGNLWSKWGGQVKKRANSMGASLQKVNKKISFNTSSSAVDSFLSTLHHLTKTLQFVTICFTRMNRHHAVHMPLVWNQWYLIIIFNAHTLFCVCWGKTLINLFCI